jgi:hypothetical protein
MEPGVQSAQLHGMTVMPVWYAISLDSLQEASTCATIELYMICLKQKHFVNRTSGKYGCQVLANMSSGQPRWLLN